MEQVDDTTPKMERKVSLAPDSGVYLSWENLTVSVEISNGAFKAKSTKEIIRGSRGRVAPGQIVAVMGPSGAGKTSLFNSLAKRGQGYTVGGELLLNGEKYSKADLKKVAGFVFQESLYHSEITVQESLRFAADLKLPDSLSAEEKEGRVQMLIDAFDLRKAADTKVGNSTHKGISGGEKKRLSIATELLTGPSLLFLDEPTTGLDAASSLMVLQLLGELAQQGVSVICVLHQPRSSILKYVDKFLVLSDGRDIFYGGMDSMVKFFESVDYPIPLRTNPLDFVLDLINTNEAFNGGDNAMSDPLGKDEESQMKKNSMKNFALLLRGESAVEQNRVEHLEEEDLDVGLIAHTDRKELAKELSGKYIKSGIFDEEATAFPHKFPDISTQGNEGSQAITRFTTLLKREFMQKLRNPEVMGTQIGGAVVISLIMGSIFFQLGDGDIFNKTSAVSFGALMTIFTQFHLILLFPVEREIWIRDRDNGLYNAAEYYFSMVVSGYPGDIIASFLLSTIFYWMVGLNGSASKYFTFVGFLMLGTVTAGSFMIFCGALAPSPSVANSIVSCMLLFIMIFNGFFIIYDSIPLWYRWIADINFMRFITSAVYFNEFAGETLNCTVGVECITNNGTQIVEGLGISPTLELWRMAVYMICVWIVFSIFALTAVAFMYTNFHKELIFKWKNRNGPPKEEENDVKMTSKLSSSKEVTIDVL